MLNAQKVLFVDASTGFYKTRRYPLKDYFGPVDLGLHLDGRYRSLNIGTGLFAGSILPGSNRLVFTGFSPCWRSFYISSMGGAGLAFDNLGINMVSIIGKSAAPSILYLNRDHGEEVEVELIPVDAGAVWSSGRGGAYSMMDTALQTLGPRYHGDYRALAVGPAALASDFAGILSAPVKNGKATDIDTWAGRGGFGSSLLADHGIAAVIYGGTVIDEDFRDRKVADGWFEEKYKQRLAVKDFESTTKYRFDPKFETGGTFGVNYATVGGRIIAFNYRTIDWSEERRLDLHKRFVLDHYLRQFNEETIKTKNQHTCGEPCSAVCKKLNGEFKKDYEPYQTLGPLCGIFDQRAAELLNKAGDAAGFDAISLGGVLAWLMDCLDTGALRPEDLGVSGKPRWDIDGFDPVEDSMHNAKLGLELIDSILKKRGVLDLQDGPRKWARSIRRSGGDRILDGFVHTANGRMGWMVPNQYWTPGVLAPMAIMGKYYMHYGPEFLEPRKLGRKCAERLKTELVMDNAGVCRFHRAWAEDLIPQALNSLYDCGSSYAASVSVAASRINSRNSSVYWESERNIRFVSTFLERILTSEKKDDPELLKWVNAFRENPAEAALNFWFEVRKGIDESLRDFL
ncbi:MAG TPA: aldehyde ferredoxin oxidoreductase [Treponema sp.]|nr:MAG: aldehyde ferredoxin oxidoreductase [Treponema sp. GWA1_62_8]OHE68389.1 MAG: aldehyde ferredoxin oxidoreductase [Treponema sp. GWC1_61_84]OHE71275.1 MAG: aldehyde ferredoxin oxidoreductase [Treponema sp. RIFOXYC1_FULL_61_9]HCM28794.1 aldehyde ferredoxin oxidoreductase [Treponema sp.]